MSPQELARLDGHRWPNMFIEHGTPRWTRGPKGAGTFEPLTITQEEVPSGSNVYLMSTGRARTLAEGSAALHMSLQA